MTPDAARGAQWWIASAVLMTFSIIMGAVLFGCYLLVARGVRIDDAPLLAAVSGLVGSVVGYVAANAQTVINFVFGGSLGSQRKTDALAAGIRQAIDRDREAPGG